MTRFWHYLAALTWIVTIGFVPAVILSPEFAKMRMPAIGGTTYEAFENYGIWLLVALGVSNYFSALHSAKKSERERRVDGWLSFIGLVVMCFTAFLFYIQGVGDPARVATFVRNLLFFYLGVAVLDVMWFQLANENRVVSGIAPQDAVHGAYGQKVRMVGDVPVPMPEGGYPTGHEPQFVDSRTQLPNIVTPRYIDIVPVFRLVRPDGTRVVIPPEPREVNRIADATKTIDHEPTPPAPPAKV